MNIKKIGEFLKRHAFYVAVGVVSVGALTAIFLMPNGEGNVNEEPNPYARNEETAGKAEEGIIDGFGDVVIEYEEDFNNQTSESSIENNALTDEDQAAGGEQKASSEQSVKNEAVVAETFESTTASAVAQKELPKKKQIR